MENIFKKLIKIKTNLNLCSIKFASKEKVVVNVDGYILNANIDKDRNIDWRVNSEKVDILESAILNCVLTPYILNFLDIKKITNMNIEKEELFLEEIRDKYIENCKYIDKLKTSY